MLEFQGHVIKVKVTSAKTAAANSFYFLLDAVCTLQRFCFSKRLLSFVVFAPLKATCINHPSSRGDQALGRAQAV